jgi:dTDP-glucose pyrophosphorylase/CBS domain-containing protein
MKKENVVDLFVSPDSAIRDVITCIDRSGRISIALIVDGDGRLLNTITDGDIRRAILAGLNLDAPISQILPIKARLPNPLPITAPVGTDPDTLMRIMKERSVRQIPLLDGEGKVADIVILSDLLPQNHVANMQAVIMAGGFGKRLQPLTDDLPKPMLPVGGKPLMELIVDQLKEAGIHEIIVSTHYKPEKIINHFGSGREFDVNLTYVNEEQPLGTGGVLGLMQPPTESLLVVNGDILTRINFRTMHAYHQEQNADMTVAVSHFSLQVPYGVIECDGSRVRSISEKPQLNFFVNAGIYLLEPVVFKYIKTAASFNMTDLIQWLLDAGRSVVSFPVFEYWLDIGQLEDYRKAQDDVHGEKQ